MIWSWWGCFYEKQKNGWISLIASKKSSVYICVKKKLQVNVSTETWAGTQPWCLLILNVWWQTSPLVFWKNTSQWWLVFGSLKLDVTHRAAHVNTRTHLSQLSSNTIMSQNCICIGMPDTQCCRSAQNFEVWEHPELFPSLPTMTESS